MNIDPVAWNALADLSKVHAEGPSIFEFYSNTGCIGYRYHFGPRPGPSPRMTIKYTRVMQESVRRNICDNYNRMFKARFGYHSSADDRLIMRWRVQFADAPSVEDQDDYVLTEMYDYHHQ